MFQCKFDTDNAAFVECGTLEVADILKDIAALVKKGYTFDKIRDTNGNVIGDWRLDLPIDDEVESQLNQES